MNYCKIIIVLTILLVVTACSNKSNYIEEVYDYEINDDFVSGVLADKLYANTTIIVPNGIESCAYATANIIDVSKYSNIIKTTVFSDNEDITVNENIFQSEKGSGLYIGDSLIHFTTPFYSSYIRRLLYAKIHLNSQFYDMGNFEHIKNMDLPFKKSSDCIIDLKFFLDSLGISVADQVEIYALDHVTSETIEKEYYNDNILIPQKGENSAYRKEQWNSDDDIYLFEFNIEINSLPVYRGSFGTFEAGNYVQENDISICYSKNGIESLIINNPYILQKTNGDYMKVVGIETIVSNIAKYYSEVILTYPMTLKKLELCYVPTSMGDDTHTSFYLVPAWVCTLEQNIIEQNSSEYIVVSTLFYDAITGRELV